jgi:DNA modification methylase
MNERYTLHHGDCLEVLPGLPLVDSIVTDPPAGIGFMGAEWDKDKGGRDAWVAWLAARLRAARERLRPGGYALVWALPRTSHWTALAIEDAGLVIQDRLAHVFGSGFPKHKSHLKPAVEDWWLAYNPGEARALNVEACRVETDGSDPNRRDNPSIDRSLDGATWNLHKTQRNPTLQAGRWPPHLLLSHAADCDAAACVEGCPVRALGEQSGAAGGSPGIRRNTPGGVNKAHSYGRSQEPWQTTAPGDTGTAARFFPQFYYAPKASRRERETGLEGRERRRKDSAYGDGLNSATKVRTVQQAESGVERGGAANHHPTVKPLALMRWLVRLVTPPGGLVLDPFAGSGSTGCAAVLEGCGFVGVEASAEYLEIARARIAHYADPLRHMEAA